MKLKDAYSLEEKLWSTWYEVKWSESRSVVSDFVTPWTSPWNSSGQNTGVGSVSLLQGIFPTQELNRGFLHWRQILYQLTAHYFDNKDPSSQGYGFSSSHDGCESWAIKKAEHQRIDTFELWCWRRLLRVPWIARRSNQSILKEISPGCLWKDWCWSWNSNTLATRCEELTHWKIPWCWERLKVGGEGDNRGWDGWMASLTQQTWVWVNSGSWWWTGRPGVLWSMGLKRVRHGWATELNWTEWTLKQTKSWVRKKKSKDLNVTHNTTTIFSWPIIITLHVSSWDTEKRTAWDAWLSCYWKYVVTLWRSERQNLFLAF